METTANSIDTNKQPLDDAGFAEIYAQLRRLARRARMSNPQHTMSTTALVNECWLKINAHPQAIIDRKHYLCMAAIAMRQILVDYARYRGAAKRDRAEEVPLIEECLRGTQVQTADELLSLDRALSELEALDERAAQLVMLRFFAGLSMDDAAETLGISPRSAARDWTRARAFLVTQLQA